MKLAVKNAITNILRGSVLRLREVKQLECTKTKAMKVNLTT